jgi:hypothetical protein
MLRQYSSGVQSTQPDFRQTRQFCREYPLIFKAKLMKFGEKYASDLCVKPLSVSRAVLT